MRKIEREMLSAVHNRRDWQKDNTAVHWFDEGHGEVMLHDNKIALLSPCDEPAKADIQTLKQWPTVTTLSRLRALGISVHRANTGIYLDGKYVCPAR